MRFAWTPLTSTDAGGIARRLNTVMRALASLLSNLRRDPAGGYFFDGSFLELEELSADPAAPSDGRVRVYAKESAVAGKTGLYARFPTGAVQEISVEP